MNKLRYHVDLHTLRQLYFSFIYPYLTYGITSWGSACKTRLHKIKTKQNKCVRSIFFAYSRDNAIPYFNLLEILTLEKFKVALFTHKITNNATNVPMIFKGTLTLASEVHSYNIRFVSNLDFHQPRISNNYGAATFAFIGSKISWENIKKKFKKLRHNNFYKHYKLYLLNTQ